MKLKLTILSTLLLWLFVVSSCQEDPQEQVFPDFESTEAIVTLKSAPQLINIFNNFPGNTGLLNARGESTEFDENTQLATMDFGTLDLSAITQLISEAEQPNPNYTIRLYPPENVANALEYLVLIGAEGGYVAQIHQYQVHEDFKETIGSPSTFTGTHSIMDLSRTVQSATHYMHGEIVDSLPSEESNNGRGDLNTIDHIACGCTYHVERIVSPRDFKVSHEILHIDCTCAGGSDGIPGRPGDFVTIEDGFSGGANGGTGSPSGDVLPPNPNGNGDAIIIPNVPPEIAEIYANREFMSAYERGLQCPPPGFAPVRWPDTKHPVTTYFFEVFKRFGERLLLATMKDQYWLLLADDPEEAVNIFQTLLDIGGLYPGLGEPLDVVNGVIYLTRGDFLEAGLSGISVIPVGGDAVGKGLRYTLRIIEKTPAGKLTIKAIRENASLAQVLSFLNTIKDLGGQGLKRLFDDIIKAPRLLADFILKPGTLDAWKRFNDIRISDALRRNVNFLDKFNQLVKNNKLGLDANRLEDLIKSPLSKTDAASGKQLFWDDAEAVLDAIRRTSDSGVSGVTIGHKKFPAPADGSSNFVLSNAKQYQKEASGDAALSFEKNGVSFDNVTTEGKLVDRKYGHGNSVFNPDGSVKNQNRAQSIIDQGRAQVNASGGTPIKWEVSTELGADGIQDLFDAQVPPIDIEVFHVPQKTIIN